MTIPFAQLFSSIPPPSCIRSTASAFSRPAGSKSNNRFCAFLLLIRRLFSLHTLTLIQNMKFAKFYYPLTRFYRICFRLILAKVFTFAQPFVKAAIFPPYSSRFLNLTKHFSGVKICLQQKTNPHLSIICRQIKCKRQVSQL